MPVLPLLSCFTLPSGAGNLARFGPKLFIQGAHAGASGRFSPQPLFIDSSSTGSGHPTFPLIIYGATHHHSKSVPLVLVNTTSGGIRSLPLIVPGAGSGAIAGTTGLPGGSAYGINLGLVVRYGPAAAISLFVRAPGSPVASGIPLYMPTNRISASGLPLCLPGVKATPSKTITLKVTGF